MNHIQNTAQEESLKETLLQIRQFMERELEFKNAGLKRQSEAIESLLLQREELKQQLAASQAELQAAKQLADGKKQLIDKLLGDVARLQQDVEWYKRTYEERSFWGTIKEKVRKKR